MGAWLVSVVIMRLMIHFILRSYYLRIDVKHDAIVSSYSLLCLEMCGLEDESELASSFILEKIGRASCRERVSSPV